MRKDFTVFAALAAAALVATPLVIGATNASATVEDGPMLRTIAVAPVEVAPVAAPPLRLAPCLRKVRVVYGGYGMPDTACQR